MRLILAHDYLVQMGGAERVVAAMHEAFPRAPIYTSVCAREGLWDELKSADIHTSWMQRLPYIGDPTHFKKYFLLYPAAFRSFGTIDADVAWVSSSTFAKYLRFTPRTRVVYYLHNTTRFLWQTDDYIDHEVRARPLNLAVRTAFPFFRQIDRSVASKLSTVVANSVNVQQRIKAYYGIDSLVVPPPVDTSRFSLSREHGGYYLVMSRLIGYKNIELPVRAFASWGRRLIVAGDGPDLRRLREINAPGVELRGRVTNDELASLARGCRALVLPGEEDFGITPVEAMACGKPVIALGRGGALETVIDGRTGIFFHEPTVEALRAAVLESERTQWDPEGIRQQALTFSKERFIARMSHILFGRQSAAAAQAASV